MACRELTENKITWNFPSTDFTDKIVAPGTYTYTYEVCTGTCTNPLLKQTFQVTVVIEDPCVNPTFTVPSTSIQTYTITAADAVYELTPKFSVTPAICGGEFSITSPGISDKLILSEETQEITLI